MEYQGIEKLRGAENWNIWKFAVRNLLCGTENANEVCISEIVKPATLAEGTTVEQKTTYEASLKIWNKAIWAAGQIIVKTLEAKVMALL